jgi:ribosome-associated protein
VDALEERKGEDILLLDIQEQTVIADYFVICTGTSPRMVSALIESVKQTLKQSFKLHTRIEGTSEHGWMLADYGDVIVHVFSEEQRSFYQLEELWSEGKVLVRLH